MTASNLEGLYTSAYLCLSRNGRVSATTYDRNPYHGNDVLCQCSSVMELFSVRVQGGIMRNVSLAIDFSQSL